MRRRFRPDPRVAAPHRVPAGAGIAFAVLAAAFLFPGSPVQARDRDDAAFSRKRLAMVEEQVAARGVRDAAVLEALRTVPRHLFVPPELRDEAYGDHPLPIGKGQTISQPYVVGLMTQSLGLRKGEKVLEVGTGSGYQAAILSRLAGEVFSIEINGTLARLAGATLKRLGFTNVTVKRGDGFFGWPEEAPFDAIIVTCAVDRVPPGLMGQLKDGGRLILPLGDPRFFQRLTLVTKKNGNAVVREIIDVQFVPMTGEALKKKRGD